MIHQNELFFDFGIHYTTIFSFDKKEKIDNEDFGKENPCYSCNTINTIHEFSNIGHIKDSVDLLILLYLYDDNFNDKQLDNVLSDLYSQYPTEESILKQKLDEFADCNVDARSKRNKKVIAKKLSISLNKLNKFDFSAISALYILKLKNPSVESYLKF